MSSLWQGKNYLLMIYKLFVLILSVVHVQYKFSSAILFTIIEPFCNLKFSLWITFVLCAVMLSGRLRSVYIIQNNVCSHTHICLGVNSLCSYHLSEWLRFSRVPWNQRSVVWLEQVVNTCIKIISDSVLLFLFQQSFQHMLSFQTKVDLVVFNYTIIY